MGPPRIAVEFTRSISPLFWPQVVQYSSFLDKLKYMWADYFIRERTLYQSKPHDVLSIPRLRNVVFPGWRTFFTLNTRNNNNQKGTYRTSAYRCRVYTKYISIFLTSSCLIFILGQAHIHADELLYTGTHPIIVKTTRRTIYTKVS